MDKDPNKIYIEDSSGTREATKVNRDAAYKASRERFLAQREKYKNTPMPAQTVKEAAAAIKRGTQAGHAVTDNNNHTRPIK